LILAFIFFVPRSCFIAKHDLQHSPGQAISRTVPAGHNAGDPLVAPVINP
jgi:hypothetical protein